MHFLLLGSELHYLDLSCAGPNNHTCGEDGSSDSALLPFLQAANMSFSCLCISLPQDHAESFKQVLTQLSGSGSGSRRLRGLRSIADMPPAIRHALQPVHDFMSMFDILCVGNGAGPSDSYLFGLARLAGVKVRVLDLGPRALPCVIILPCLTYLPDFWHECMK